MNDALKRHAGWALFGIVLATYLLCIFLRFQVYHTYYMASDNEGLQYVPVSLIRDGDMYLDEYIKPGQEQFGFMLRKLRGHVIALHPAGPALLALPWYYLADFAAPDLNRAARYLWRMLAALYTACGVVALHGIACRMTGDRRKALFAALFAAFGTSVFSTASQDLFSNTAVFFLSSLALLAISRDPRRVGWLALALLAFAAICRPASWLNFAVAAGYGILVERSVRCAAKICAVFLAALLVQFAINHHLTGNVLFTPYYFAHLNAEQWGGDILDHVLGFWLSPAFGVVWYAPFGIVMLYAALRTLPRLLAMPSAVVISAACFFSQLAVFAVYTCWYGGYSYGPRFLIDLMPFGFVLMLPWLASLRVTRTTAIAASAMLVYSFFIQATGAVHFDGRWNAKYELYPRLSDLVWNWSDPPPAWYIPAWLSPTKE